MSLKFATVALASIAFSFAPSPARADDVPGPAPAATTAPAAAKLSVQVLGRVEHPGAYKLDAGTRLSDALNAAGAWAFETLVARLGGTPVPDTECMLGGSGLQNVFLMRTTETSKNMGYMIDVTMMRRQHDLRYDPLLQDRDRIFVPECRPKAKFIPTPPMFPISQA